MGSLCTFAHSCIPLLISLARGFRRTMEPGRTALTLGRIAETAGQVGHPKDRQQKGSRAEAITETLGLTGTSTLRLLNDSPASITAFLTCDLHTKHPVALGLGQAMGRLQSDHSTKITPTVRIACDNHPLSKGSTSSWIPSRHEFRFL